MPFCPRCGLNVADLDDDEGRPAWPSGEIAGEPAAVAPSGSATSEAAETADTATESALDVAATAAPSGTQAGPGIASTRAPGAPSPGTDRRAFSIPPIVVASIFVMVGLIAFGLLTRPQPGGPVSPGGQPSPGATLAAPAAPIVGLSILSPSDGQVVAAAEVTVIGTAPPGLAITQDISFGLDQHASVDGTGHWAIKVGLNEGDNKLTFRIGDDRSTERTIHVTYTPQRTP
jgi:hypothetical protein